VIFIASSLPGSGLPSGIGPFTSLAHFCEFAIFACFIIIALSAKVEKKWLLISLTVIIATLYGVSDEVHQIFVPGRTPDIWDIVCDFSGAVAGSLITFAVYLRKVRL
jgi:VanZ family protein